MKPRFILTDMRKIKLKHFEEFGIKHKTLRLSLDFTSSGDVSTITKNDIIEYVFKNLNSIEKIEN